MTKFLITEYRSALQDAGREISKAREPQGRPQEAYEAIERAEHALFEARQMLTSGGRYEPLSENPVKA